MISIKMFELTGEFIFKGQSVIFTFFPLEHVRQSFDCTAWIKFRQPWCCLVLCIEFFSLLPILAHGIKVTPQGFISHAGLLEIKFNFLAVKTCSCSKLLRPVESSCLI